MIRVSYCCNFLPDLAINVMDLLVVFLHWSKLQLKNAVSPSCTTCTRVVLFASHITFFVWSLSIFSDTVTSPAFTGILHSNVFESSIHCQLEALLGVTISCSKQFWKISVSRIFITTEVGFTKKRLVYCSNWLRLWKLLQSEDFVSPACSTSSRIVFSTFHVAFTVWSFTILTEGVSSPTLSSILKACVFIASIHSLLETISRTSIPVS